MNKVLFFFLIAISMNAQDTIVFPKVDTYRRNIIEVSYGTPLGKLADKYENSINTAFYMRTKIAKRQYIDFGVEISGIINGRDIAYGSGADKIILEGSKSAFFLGLRYSRIICQSRNENFHIETNSAIGWKYLYYTKPEDEIYDEMDIKPSLNTIAISQGLKVMYHGFGVHCSYQYAPYGLFNSKAERGFGGASFNIGLSGSWNF